MQNDGTRSFSFRAHLGTTFAWLILAVGVLSALHSPTLAGWMGGEHTVTITAAADETTTGPTATPAGTDLAPDTTDEGRDVLMLGSAGAPYDLWNSLVQHTEWYDDQGTGGEGTFYVPVGAVLDVPGGLYLATLDGWAGCRDGWWAQECSATGPVTMLDIPVQSTVPTADCAAAARSILFALDTWTTWIEEDLSYAGMSDTVAQCNDQLAAAYYATPGHTFEHGFLGLRGAKLRAFLAQYADAQTV